MGQTLYIKIQRTGVRVKQRDHFPLNVSGFPLPSCWLYAKCNIGAESGMQKAENSHVDLPRPKGQK
jgi:hypothetical protein